MLLGVIVLGVIGANGVLLLPYARALWWQHVYRTPPERWRIPVAGVPVENLSPSFGAPRAMGPHEGIDIAAADGTPVVAAADGVVIGNRPTMIGGHVLWLMGTGGRLYYYAHLRELAPRMIMGRFVAAGEQIGSVGNSGNASTTVPHLHFAIYLVTSRFYPMRYHPIDPYPLLVAAAPDAAPGETSLRP
jgi:murein DD-endopeptidase MepM/ murein hydrolase activator NlpD